MTKSKIPPTAGKLFILVILLLAVLQTVWFGVNAPVFAQSVDTAWVRRENGTGKDSTWEWFCIDSTGPRRFGMGCAYDKNRDVIVIFGGDSSFWGDFQQVEDTWEWDKQNWTQVATSGPPRRHNCAMVYDEARAEVFLFGGWRKPDSYYGDTWVWNGSVWTEKIVAGPSARANCAVTYDRKRQRVVLFGGSYYGAIYAETWEWDGNNWGLRATGGPSPRMYSYMVYDTTRGRCLLFGGQRYYGDIAFHDTWEWDGTVWVQVDTGGPPARMLHMMTYDPIRNRTVLFGGMDQASDPDKFFSDTWEWDGVTWTKMIASAPGLRCHGQMVFHDSLAKTVLFGGTDYDTEVFGDMWTYPGIEFLCGDVNKDGVVNSADVSYLINYLFIGGPTPVPILHVGDVNQDEAVNSADVAYLINYLFIGGPAPCS